MKVYMRLKEKEGGVGGGGIDHYQEQLQSPTITSLP